MKKLVLSNAFRKDVKRAAKRGKSLSKLQKILDLLQEDLPLPSRTRPHKLTGNYIDFYECHIEPDWLLIYEVTETKLLLSRTGSHADLFG